MKLRSTIKILTEQRLRTCKTWTLCTKRNATKWFWSDLTFSHLFGGHGSGYGGRHGCLLGFQHGGGHDADICDCD